MKVLYDVILLGMLLAFALHGQYAKPETAPAAVVDMYAPARNAEAQAKKDRIVWQRIGADLAADLQ